MLAIAAGCSFSPQAAGVDAHAGADAHVTADGANAMPPDAPHTCSAAYDIVGPDGSYRFTAGSGTWQQAEADCASDGNHLVKVDSADEDAFLFANIVGSGGGFYWIGLYDPTSTDTYQWADGTALGGYQNFGSGSASPDKDCVDESFSNGKWAAWYCDPASQQFSLQVGVCECDP